MDSWLETGLVIESHSDVDVDISYMSKEGYIYGLPPGPKTTPIIAILMKKLLYSKSLQFESQILQLARPHDHIPSKSLH
ncbi:hypothetical protein FRX31_030529 [Thalictrum thalictroides]|uniref:Uncharacterized protein n=1 Tax=Thalictrum thalictroides TaxID=46969 RepID=A0A7J6V6S3_THATH|nr:hypothetical protein FRX31_030529 [Thalictrum thalictroides]